MVICGGFVTNLTNWVGGCGSTDLDIFMYGDIDYVNTLLEFERINKLSLSVHNNNYCEYKFNYNFKVQVILRKFKSISDILNGFDLDASQVAMDHENLYYTDRFLLSYQNKINIFNIDKASPSYIHRLNKYKIQKGYNIVSPFGELKHSNINSFESCYCDFVLEGKNKVISNIKYFANIHDKFWYSRGSYADEGRGSRSRKKHRRYKRKKFSNLFLEEIDIYLETGSLKGTCLEELDMDISKIKKCYEDFIIDNIKRPEIVFIEEGLNRYRSYKKEVDYYLYFEPILTPNHYPFIFNIGDLKQKLNNMIAEPTYKSKLPSEEKEKRICLLMEQIEINEYYTQVLYLLDKVLPFDIYEYIVRLISIIRIYELYDNYTKKYIAPKTDEDYYIKSKIDEDDDTYNDSSISCHTQ